MQKCGLIKEAEHIFQENRLTKQALLHMLIM